MLCCLLIALFGSPLVFRANPDMASQSDHCIAGRSSFLAFSAIIVGVAALCLAMAILARFQPATLGHICSVLGR
jgi:hypothetical protein